MLTTPVTVYNKSRIVGKHDYSGHLYKVFVKAGDFYHGETTLSFEVYVSSPSELKALIKNVEALLGMQWGAEALEPFIEVSDNA